MSRIVMALRLAWTLVVPDHEQLVEIWRHTGICTLLALRLSCSPNVSRDGQVSSRNDQHNPHSHIVVKRPFARRISGPRIVTEVSNLRRLPAELPCKQRRTQRFESRPHLLISTHDEFEPARQLCVPAVSQFAAQWDSNDFVADIAESCLVEKAVRIFTVRNRSS